MKCLPSEQVEPAYYRENFCDIVSRTFKTSKNLIVAFDMRELKGYLSPGLIVLLVLSPRLNNLCVASKALAYVDALDNILMADVWQSRFGALPLDGSRRSGQTLSSDSKGSGSLKLSGKIIERRSESIYEVTNS
jgi:hypothetical protein